MKLNWAILSYLWMSVDHLGCHKYCHTCHWTRSYLGDWVQFSPLRLVGTGHHFHISTQAIVNKIVSWWQQMTQHILVNYHSAPRGLSPFRLACPPTYVWLISLRGISKLKFTRRSQNSRLQNIKLRMSVHTLWASVILSSTLPSCLDFSCSLFLIYLVFFSSSAYLLLFFSRSRPFLSSWTRSPAAPTLIICSPRCSSIHPEACFFWRQPREPKAYFTGGGFSLPRALRN